MMWNVMCTVTLAHALYANMEEAGYVSFIAATHKGAIKMFWLHLWGAVIHL